MPTPKWTWIKKTGRRLALGRQWGEDMPRGIQRNLRWFFFDGVMGAGLDGSFTPFLSLYLLALGASSSQIGVMTSLAGLAGTLVLLPGAVIAERTGKRKLMFAACGAGVARFSILVTALLPLLVPRQAAIYFIIAIKVAADGLGNFSGPAWTSLAGDLVPVAWRGRYFGSRNFFMSIGTMAATFLAGNLISSLSTTSGGQTGLAGYQIAFGIGFMMGMISTGLFLQVKEPPLAPAASQQGLYSLRSLWDTVAGDPTFRHYAIFSTIWNGAIGVGGPYFTLYMVQVLKATPSEIGVFTIAGSLAALPALHLFGTLADRWGARKVQLVTGIIIPLLPLAWILAKAPVHGTLINIPGEILWAGYNLASFNFLLSLAPLEKRARYAALFQVTVALSTAVGTLLGSVVLGTWGYIPVFVISGVGRFVGIGYFAKYVNSPQS